MMCDREAIHMNVYVYVNACMHMCMYEYVRENHVGTAMYAYTYIHTYIHTTAQSCRGLLMEDVMAMYAYAYIHACIHTYITQHNHVVGCSWRM